MGVALENVAVSQNPARFQTLKRRVPEHLKSQSLDLAYRYIERCSRECVNGLNYTNALEKAENYKKKLLQFFATEGTALLRRMLATKKLCELVLLDFNRTYSSVLHTQHLEAIALLCQLRQFYPISAKYRNSPNAMKKMCELANSLGGEE